MSGWMGLLQGLGSGLEQVGLMQMQGMQKHQQMEDENRLMMLRERQAARLRPPTERTRTMDDPDNPGHKIQVQEQYQLPNDDTSQGSWQETARVHVPVAWKENEKYIQGKDGQAYKQKVLQDPDNPDNAKPFGDPIPVWNPEEAKRTQLEGGRLDMEGQRLDFDKKKFEQEQADKNDPAKRAALMPYEPIAEETEDAQGNKTKTHKRFDRRSGVLDNPPSRADLPQDPAQYVPGSPSMYAGADPSYAASQVGAGPLSQLSPTGGGGSAPSMNPQPAKGGDHGGAAIPVTNRKTGQKGLKYPDGTIVPQ